VYRRYAPFADRISRDRPARRPDQPVTFKLIHADGEARVYSCASLDEFQPMPIEVEGRFDAKNGDVIAGGGTFKGQERMETTVTWQLRLRK
jgi:hypothetical protein